MLLLFHSSLKFYETKMKIIEQLTDFKEKNTLILLYERTLYIERIISIYDNIRSLDTKIVNYLGERGLPLLCGTDFILTDATYVLYRSLFQSAQWEKDKCKISEKAYGIEGRDKEYHDKVVDYVNKVLAHQDNVNSKIDTCFQRMPYEIQNHPDGFEFVVISNGKGPASDLKSLVDLIKSSILKAYKVKFGKELPIIPPYEPLEKRK